VVHGFAVLEPSWPRPLSCRARSPFVAGPDLRLVGHVPIVGASQYAFHARSVVLGSPTALDLRNGPESSCLRGPSGRLWIRALIPHSALSLNLALRVLASFPGPTPPLLLARSATGSLGCSAILPGTRTRRDAVNAPTWGPITVMSFRSGRLAEFRLLARTGLAPDQFRRSEGTQTLPAGALGQRGSNTSKRGNRRGSISTGRSSVSDWGRGLGASGRRVSE
jgi:hypothetical protein